LSAAGRLNVVRPIIAATRIVIQIASGADYPTVRRALIIVLPPPACSPNYFDLKKSRRVEG
jgi:hypothetical protein